jgi:hypothetical protein
MLRLTKFDVAERQLLQAIKLFFNEEDPVSIHTLSESASQVLYDIGQDHGVFSIARDTDLIVPERKKEWLAAVFKSRNFFKHADKDPNGVHEFKEEFNDMSLMDAVNMYGTLKKCWTPETIVFNTWFGLAHPGLLRKGTDFEANLKFLADDPSLPGPDDKKFFGRLIKHFRAGKGAELGLCMSHGISITPSVS